MTPTESARVMIHLPPQLSLLLSRIEIAGHLDRVDRFRLAQARSKAEHDRAELARAWQALDSALKAESSSRKALLALTG